MAFLADQFLACQHPTYLMKSKHVNVEINWMKMQGNSLGAQTVDQSNKAVTIKNSGDQIAHRVNHIAKRCFYGVKKGPQ